MNDFTAFANTRVTVQSVQEPGSIIRGKIRLHAYKYEVDMTPQQARELAEIIRRAADEAEGKDMTPA